MSKIKMSEPNDPKHFYPTIRGTKHVYTLQEGEKWAAIQDTVIIVHPDRQPKIIDSEGNERVIEFFPK